MIELIKMEIYKCYKSRYFIIPSIISIFSLILVLYVSYYDTNTRDEILSYSFHLMVLGENFIYTLAAITFFTPLYISEYSKGTVKNMFNSKYKREQIIIAKFFAYSIFFTGMLILFTIISYISFVIIISTVSGERNIFLNLIKDGIYIRIIFITLTQLSFSFSICSFIFVIGSIWRNTTLCILFSLIIISIYKILPLPYFIQQYSFINSARTANYLMSTFFPKQVFYKFLFSNIITIVVFLLISLNIVEKQEIH